MSQGSIGPMLRALTLLALLAGAALAGSEAGEPVATLEALSGLVEVQRHGEWFEADEGDPLELLDTVRTDVDALARIVFLDGDEATGAEATVVDLTPETEVSIQELSFDEGDEPARSGFLEMLRGALNAVTKGWGNGSIFSVRAGTTVCGIRGSIANVAFDPSEDTATVTSLDGDMFTFDATERQEAMRLHREARLALRAQKRVAFARALAIGDQAVRARGRPGQLRRVQLEQVAAARKQILANRAPGGLRNAVPWARAFAKVKASGRAPRQRVGNTLRARFGRPEASGPALGRGQRILRRLGPGGRGRLGPGGRGPGGRGLDELRKGGGGPGGEPGEGRGFGRLGRLSAPDEQGGSGFRGARAPGGPGSRLRRRLGRGAPDLGAEGGTEPRPGLGDRLLRFGEASGEPGTGKPLPRILGGAGTARPGLRAPASRGPLGSRLPASRLPDRPGGKVSTPTTRGLSPLIRPATPTRSPTPSKRAPTTRPPASTLLKRLQDRR